MKRLVPIAAMVMACAAAWSMPASAQLAPGVSGFSSAPIEGSQDEYWWLLREVGRCTASLKFEESTDFLASEVNTKAEKRAFDQLFGSKRNVCMRDFVSMVAPRAYFRGTLAESMYKKISGGTVPVVAPLAENVTVASMHEFAQCYVASNTTAAHNLLTDTQLGTNEERKAIRAMVPQFGPCVPAGIEFNINPPELRMAFAEALYRASLGAAIERN